MNKKHKIALITLFISASLCFTGQADPLFAAITGECSNCHTMHNSQGGAPMATYGAIGQDWTGTGPYPLLTRGNCLGCHGMGTTSNIETINGSDIPQVFHINSTSDLAGGNFAYITGAKGGGASDAKGHNVVDLGTAHLEGTLYAPPGGVNSTGSYDHATGDTVNSTNLTCAGQNGCHGTRVMFGSTSGLANLKGAHHRNVDGQLDSAVNVYDSYRFLHGVQGLENPTANPAERWQNVNSASHNEYYGVDTPPSFSCGGGSSGNCHIGGLIRPPNNTISDFCGLCHGNFHTLTTSTNTGIGSGTSPFQRHPSDIVIPATGEYAAYTTYNVQAPVGRTGSVPVASSGTVTPGTDVVICLSCHGAHATNYPDILRWDYSNMVAGGGTNTDGCFICHTTKDDGS